MRIWTAGHGFAGATALAFGALILEAGEPRMGGLFLDQRLFESSENLQLALHRAEPAPQNPVMTGDRPWEENNVALKGTRAVIYDEEEKLFKMWYLVGGSPPPDARDKSVTGVKRTAYATAVDGLHWMKPNLGQVRWGDIAETNIVATGEFFMRRANVIKEPRDPDPARRYKVIYGDLIDGRVATVKGFSADGLHWTLNADGQPIFPPHSEDLMGWDPALARYVMYGTNFESGGPVRGIGRMTSQDFLHWSELSLIMPAEPPRSRGVTEVNPRISFSGLGAFLCHGLYLGLLSIKENRPRAGVAPDAPLNSQDWEERDAGAELVVSHDGIKWERPFPGELIIHGGKPGAWDDKSIDVAAPVFAHGKAWIYTTGGNRMRRQAGKPGYSKAFAIGVATLPLDRFVSLDATTASGIATTRLLELPSGQLRVNARIRGELRVEVLGDDGKPVRGWSAAECVPLQGDGMALPVRWKDKEGLAGLGSRAVRLRFVARDAELFAFTVEP